jgi:dimethylamine monooxygenase subunit B
MTLAIEVVVKNITVMTPAIKKFTLEAKNQSVLPGFSGGSHITTYIQSPLGTLERQYSIFNTTNEKGLYEIAVRLAEHSNGGSRYWHEQVEVGDVINISFPKNYFQLSFQAKHHVFYAAGIGITTFLSMMNELLVNNGSFELHYAAKSKEQCAFYDYLRMNYPDQCYFYLSNDDEGNVRLSPTQLADHRIGTHVYFCGPETMIQEFTAAAKGYGYPAYNIHFERFAPPSRKEQRAFQVKLINSGKQLVVPKDSTLLEVLRQNGINVPYSCRVGGCGTCEVKVIVGKIVHFDSFLTEEQQCSNTLMLSCVSRGVGTLVLKI